MFISIIMPMRNAELYVKKAIYSIIDGGYEEFEIIIINDGSTDNSLKIVKQINDPRILVIPGDCNGIAAAFNKALEYAKGDIVARCDADDLYVKGRLEWQVTWLHNHPEYDGVCSNFSMIDFKDEVVNDTLNSSQHSEEITFELTSGITRTHYCSYAIKTDVLRRIRGCREYFITAEDIDLQLRIGENAKIWYEDKVSYYYRLHEVSITHSQPNNQRVFFEETAREFQKQRGINKFDDLEKGCPPIPPEKSDAKQHTAKEHIKKMLVASAWKQHNIGNRKKALIGLLKALKINLIDFTIWKMIIAMVFKK